MTDPRNIEESAIPAAIEQPTNPLAPQLQRTAQPTRSNRRTKPSVRQRELAKLVLEGLDYPTIATKMAVVTQYPSQAVYSMLGTKGAKMAIQEQLEQVTDYNPEYLRKRLTDVLTKPDSQGLLIRALDLGMRSEAMLVERREIYDRTDRGEIEARAAQLAIAMLRSAEVGSATVVESLPPVPDIGTPSTPEPQAGAT